LWYERNPKEVATFERQMRRKVHYVIQPEYAWDHIVHLAKTQSDKLLKTLQTGLKHMLFEATTRHNKFLKELGLPLLPVAKSPPTTK
jgi:type I restriction enzyme M protein